MRRRKSVDQVVDLVDDTARRLEMNRRLGPFSPTKIRQRGPKKLDIAPSVAARYMARLEEMIDEGLDEQESFEPSYFVALFCWAHEAIYGVSCLEEVRREWRVATSAVGRMMAKEFDGDHASMLQYVRWVSADEERLELWRRKHEAQGRRMRWRDLFLSHSRLGDWRLAEARKNTP